MNAFISNVEHGSCCSSCMSIEINLAIEASKLIGFNDDRSTVVIRVTDEEIIVIQQIEQRECVSCASYRNKIISL